MPNFVHTAAVSRARASRLNSLERRYEGSDICPACRGNPPSGSVVIELDEQGKEARQSGTPACRGCGDRGPTLVLTIDPRTTPAPTDA